MPLYRRTLTVLAAAALGLGVAACNTVEQTAPVAGLSPSLPPGASASLAQSASAAATSSGSPLSLLTEPAATIAPIYQLITGARSSIDLTMYELADTTAEADLAAAAARGVTVRVLLDQHLEQSSNQAAYDYLTAHKVQVHWAPAETTYHQKTLTVDNATSAVMTLNMVTEDYPDTRDFAVLDNDHADVAAIVKTFNADFAGQSIAPPAGTDLVWSPTTAQKRRPVHHQVRHPHPGRRRRRDGRPHRHLSPGRGGQARRQRHHHHDRRRAMAPSLHPAHPGRRPRPHLPRHHGALYIHAKAIVADAGQSDQQLLVGSQNFSAASLLHNRELGILTTDKTLISSVSSTIAADYAGAKPYASTTSSTAKSSAAQCTATATVYNAAKNENDVTVHSNQPNTEATASAAGHTATYKTNSSGTAVIYLNGPARGSKITVAVGGATCTTSDLEPALGLLATYPRQGIRSSLPLWLNVATI